MNIAGLIPTQVLNKIIQNNDYDFVKRNCLDSTYFVGFEEHLKFIEDHYAKYGKCPDMTTFLGQFNDFAVYEVNETDDYLLDRLQEERGFYKFREIMPEVEAKLKDDSRDAYNFLVNNLEKLKPHTVCKGIDIISDFDTRYNAYLNRSDNSVLSVISSGLPELDEILGGWEYGEELVTIVGRTQQGKSWLLMKFLSGAWEQGKRVGLYSGEMSHTKLGYRFDTLYGNISNKSLTRGENICVTPKNYEDYGNSLKEHNNPFMIITQKEFGGRPTVQQIRNFIEENNIEIMGIDQLSLMEDGRAARNDLTRTRLSHIAEDLFAISSEYKIPIIALAQANREATRKDSDEAPGLENIKESDDIAHNSSKCIGMKQRDGYLILNIIKNRNGKSGDKLHYCWDIDKGIFTYAPSSDTPVSTTVSNAVTVDGLRQKKSEMNCVCPF